MASMTARKIQKQLGFWIPCASAQALHVLVQCILWILQDLYSASDSVSSLLFGLRSTFLLVKRCLWLQLQIQAGFL